MIQPLALNRFSLLPTLFLGAQIAIAPMCYSQATTNLDSVLWLHGAEDCDSAKAETGYVEWQQVRYQVNTYIFRQNKCSNYEAPFVYLLIGTDRSLLIDTGATVEGGAGLLAAVRSLTDTPLIVAHSHGHGDHTQGDSAFAEDENAVVVGKGADDVKEFFGFRSWPDESTDLDLGNRSIALLPIPGHTDDDLAYYDPTSQLIITGDTLYPGRLYVRNWQGFRSSIARLNAWIQDKPVTHVMGTHIEMTAEVNVDYPVGTTYQPNEHRLPLSVSDITLLHETLTLLEAPERTYLRNFIIWPVD